MRNEQARTGRSIPLQRLWDDEIDSDLSHRVIFHGFCPDKDEKTHVYDRLDKIVNLSPSDSNVILTIGKKKSGYFATLSVQSIRGHFFSQQNSLELRDLISLIYRDIKKQLRSDQQRSLNLRSLFLKPFVKSRKINTKSHIETRTA